MSIGIILCLLVFALVVIPTAHASSSHFTVSSQDKTLPEDMDHDVDHLPISLLCDLTHSITLEVPRQVRLGEVFDVTATFSFNERYAEFWDHCSQYFTLTYSPNYDVFGDDLDLTTSLVILEYNPPVVYHHKYMQLEYNQEPVIFQMQINDPKKSTYDNSAKGWAIQQGDIDLSTIELFEDGVYDVEYFGLVELDDSIILQVYTSISNDIVYLSDEPFVSGSNEKNLPKYKEYTPPIDKIISVDQSKTPSVVPFEILDEALKNPLNQYTFAELSQGLNLDENYLQNFLKAYPEYITEEQSGFVHSSTENQASGQSTPNITLLRGSVIVQNSDGTSSGVYGAKVCAYNYNSITGRFTLIQNGASLACDITSSSGSFLISTLLINSQGGSINPNIAIKVFFENDDFKIVYNSYLPFAPPNILRESMPLSATQEVHNILDKRPQSNINAPIHDYGSFIISNQKHNESKCSNLECDGTSTHETSAPAAYILNSLQPVADWYGDTVGYTPKKSIILWNADQCTNNGVSVDPTTNILNLEEKYNYRDHACDNAFYSPIENPHTLRHEYAHQIQNQIYFERGDGSANAYDCVRTHTPVHVSGPYCAWTEGWAFFMAVAYDHNPVYQPSYMKGQWNFEDRTNTEIDDPEFANKDFALGDQEGNVAAVLYDIIDSTNENMDTLDFDVSDVWNAFDIRDRPAIRTLEDFVRNWNSKNYSSLDNILELNTISSTMPPFSSINKINAFDDDFQNTLSKWHLSGNKNWMTSNPHENISYDLSQNNKVLTSTGCNIECIATINGTFDTSKPLIITFDRFVDKRIDSNEGLFVQYSADGFNWINLSKYTKNNQKNNDAWKNEVLSLSNRSDPSTYFRFLSKSNSTNEIIEIDNVNISLDTMPPVFEPTYDISIVGNGPTSINFAKPIATDNSNSIIVSCMPSFTRPFPLGTTLVTCTATDPSDNSSTITFSVTVIALDNTPPQINAPSNRTIEAAARSTSVNIGTASASDNSGIQPVITNNAPNLYPLGRTTVTWSATDGSGNVATGTQIITIQDTTPPVFDPIRNVYIQLDSVPGPVNYSTPTAQDIFNVTISCNPQSGSLFNAGTTTVTCTATDTSNNQSSTTFSVLVDDRIPFLVHAPPDITIEATDELTPADIGTATTSGSSGPLLAFTNDGPDSYPLGNTNVNWIAIDSIKGLSYDTQIVTIQDTTPPVFDPVQDQSVLIFSEPGTAFFNNPRAQDIFDVTVSCDPQSGSLFNEGANTVTCTATDTSENQSSTTFSVIATFYSKNPPVITAPSDITIEASAILSPVNIGTATATDDSGAPPIITNDAPDTYPLGQTTITWTARDEIQNTSTATQTITIQDTTPPVFDPIAGVSVQLDSAPGAVHYSAPTAQDIFNVTISCNPQSGSLFNKGTTTVSCTATDTSENQSSTTFSVVVDVLDSIPPVIAVPSDKTIEATARLSSVNIGTATATDDSGEDPTITNNAPSSYPLGQTTVTWSATDGSGNTSTDTQIITIQDTTAPVFDPIQNVSVQPPSAPTTVHYAAPTAQDIFNVTVSCNPQSGSSFNEGTTTVSCTATDTSNNQSTTTFSVLVNVVDDVPPVITVPSDKTIEATGQLTSVNIGLATATDNSGYTPTITNDAPDSYPLGQTTVTWSATDALGNVSTATQTITVQDTTRPTIVLIGDDPLTIEVGRPFIDPGATISDNVDDDKVIIGTPRISTAAPETFTIRYIATDNAGNTSILSRTIIVRDVQTSLTFDSPNIMDSTYANSKIISFNVSPPSPYTNMTCSNESGSAFNVGSTNVTCIAANSSGDLARTVFTVTVNQTRYDELKWSKIDLVGDQTHLTSFADGMTTPYNTPKFSATYSGVSWVLVEICNQQIGRNGVSGGGGFAKSWKYDPIPDQTCPLTIKDNEGSILFEALVTIDADNDGNPIDVAPPIFIHHKPESSSYEDFYHIEPGTFVRARDSLSFTHEAGTTTLSDISVIDSTDGNITSRIQTTPNISTVLPGTHTITYTISDMAGNTSSITRETIIQDTTLPIFDPTPDIQTTLGASRIVHFAPTAQDFTSVVISCTPESGSNFDEGTTLVSCTATDTSGNQSSTTFSVIAELDPTPPVISVPSDLTVEATAILTPVDIGTATATDNNGTPTITNDAPIAYPLGQTTVIWTATDQAGNTATAPQIITIQDTTPPVFDPTPDISVALNEVPGPVNFAPTAQDIFNVSISCNPQSDSNFDEGTTMVTCTATDTSGNQSSATFSVIVRLDNTNPVISVPSDITLEATGQQTVIDIGAASATDDISISPIITNDAPISYPLGQTTVTWTATDDAGNTATAPQTITIQDTTAPTITLLGDNPLSANANSYADPGTTVFDIVDGTTTITGTHTIVSFNPITLNVNYLATDSSGNESSATRTVIIQDTPTTTITIPNISDSTYARTKLVSFSHTLPSPYTSVACDRESGSVFGTGQTLVSCAASDPSGNIANASFTITLDELHFSDSKWAQIELVGDQNQLIKFTDEMTVPYNTPKFSVLFAGLDWVLVEICNQQVGRNGVSDGGAFAKAWKYDPIPDQTCPITIKDNQGNMLFEASMTIDANNDGNPTDVAPPVFVHHKPESTSYQDFYLVNQDETFSRARDNLTLVYNTSAASLQGISAIDSTDGDLTSKIQTTPSLDNKTGTHEATFTVTDSAGNTASMTRMVLVQNDPPPIIILEGGAHMKLDTSDTYTDPGAHVHDNTDPTRTITGVPASINTSVPGTHTITYTATDTAGNTSFKTRTVQVVNPAHPYIEMFGDNPLYLTVGATYKDPRILVTDDLDETRVVDVPLVDTSQVADFTTTYTVTDTSGNTSTAQRTIHIVNELPKSAQVWFVDHKDGNRQVSFRDGMTIGTRSPAFYGGVVNIDSLQVRLCGVQIGDTTINTTNDRFYKIASDTAPGVCTLDLIHDGTLLNRYTVIIDPDYVEPTFTLPSRVIFSDDFQDGISSNWEFIREWSFARHNYEDTGPIRDHSATNNSLIALQHVCETICIASSADIDLSSYNNEYLAFWLQLSEELEDQTLLELEFWDGTSWILVDSWGAKTDYSSGDEMLGWTKIIHSLEPYTDMDDFKFRLVGFAKNVLILADEFKIHVDPAST